MPKKTRGNVSRFSLTFRPPRGVQDVILQQHTSRIHKIIKHVRSPKQTKTKRSGGCCYEHLVVGRDFGSSSRCSDCSERVFCHFTPKPVPVKIT